MKEDKRLHRIKTDYGNYDYYKHFIANTSGNSVTRATFGQIVKDFNGHVRDRISTKGAEYTLPCKIGKIELRKLKTEVKIAEDGSIINNLPVNWKATRELWAESESAKEKKTKIRYTNEHTEGYTFRIFYRTSKANFKNKSIYKMKLNRTLKRQLSQSIFAGRIDAFLR
tara:strand:+ start:408 stop:914 length:507 start_codon:yes stop_codon:yes gene_type:complete